MPVTHAAGLSRLCSEADAAGGRQPHPSRQGLAPGHEGQQWRGRGPHGLTDAGRKRTPLSFQHNHVGVSPYHSINVKQWGPAEKPF